MQIEIDLRDKNRSAVVLTAALVVILVLLGILGKAVTPVSASGAPRLLTWNAWQFFKAEKLYASELETLRLDAEHLAEAINQSPDPVACQILAEQVLRHTSAGVTALSAARLALALAANDLQAWSIGVLPRDSAMTSLLSAVNLLK
jgi:hypothetical protein